MPRKWTNSYFSTGAGTGTHQFTSPTPSKMLNGKGYPVDLREIDYILATNAKLASNEQRRPYQR